MSILDTAPIGHVLGNSQALDADQLLNRIKSDLHPGQLDFVSDQLRLLRLLMTSLLAIPLESFS